MAVVKRFYNDDPMRMTFGSFMEHIKHIPKLRKWEAGEDISEDKPENAAKKLTTDEFIEAVLAGDISPDALKIKPKQLTEAEKKAEEARVLKLLKIDTGQQQFMVPPPNYGGRK